MSGFPQGTYAGPTFIINTLDYFYRAGPATGNSVATSYPAANLAIYNALVIPTTVTVTHMAVSVGTSSGNLDVGIYDEGGNRLVSSGSTAVGTGSAMQSINITDTTLTPGVYFFAMCCDNTTATFDRDTMAAAYQQIYGVQQEALGSVTLPATATFANPTNAWAPTMSAVCRMGVV